ncbi:hypothetical protein CEXT_659122 [Caerostris extrusa]|nr:hypothetical protein CEXT_659122 [Caerostris extrusa]
MEFPFPKRQKRSFQMIKTGPKAFESSPCRNRPVNISLHPPVSSTKFPPPYLFPYTNTVPESRSHVLFNFLLLQLPILPTMFSHLFCADVISVDFLVLRRSSKRSSCSLDRF